MIDSRFDALHAAMKAQVDQQFLPGVATALLRGRSVVDRFCYGHADREAGIVLREDHIFRMFSSTKLITSCALIMLVEEGRIRLEDPIDAYIPSWRTGRSRPEPPYSEATAPKKAPISLVGLRRSLVRNC